MSNKSNARNILAVFLAVSVLAIGALGFLYYQASNEVTSLEQSVSALKDEKSEAVSESRDLRERNEALSLQNWGYSLKIASQTPVCLGGGGNLAAGSLREALAVEVTGDGHINLVLHSVTRNVASGELEARAKVRESFTPSQRAQAVATFRELCASLASANA